MDPAVTPSNVPHEAATRACARTARSWHVLQLNGISDSVAKDVVAWCK